MTPDKINAFYEGFGALLICMSIWRAYADGQVKGVSLVPITFFATWGFWNLYYYPSLGQWWSFWAGVLMVSTNTVWLVQLFYYTHKPKPAPQITIRDYTEAEARAFAAHTCGTRIGSNRCDVCFEPLP